MTAQIRAPIVGTCLDMCPPNELKWREEKGLLHEFEITRESEWVWTFREKTNREKDNDPFRPKADKRKVVKQFSRSSAGQPMQSAEELRPIKVLVKTCDYLLSKVAVRDSVPWNVVYDYIFDRLRSVRQDMSIQCSDDIQCLTVLEQCIRFHIYSDYYFGAEEVRLYDRHINDTHLRECLQSLLKRYDQLESADSANNRPLFESIYLIYNLGSNDALLRYGTLPLRLQRHGLVRKSYRLALNYDKRLYYQCIQTLTAIKPPILALLASTKLPKLFHMAIKTMSFAYHSPNTKFPVSTVSQWLCPFESNAQTAEEYIEKLCQSYGLVVVNGSVGFNKTKFAETPQLFANQKWSSFEFKLKELSLPSLLRGRHELSYCEE